MTHTLILYDDIRIETGDGFLKSGSVTLSDAKEANHATFTLSNTNLSLTERLRAPSKRDKVPVEIWMGETRALDKVFSGYAVGHSDSGPPPILTITAMDKTRGMRREERAKNWSSTTPEALVKELARRADLEVDLSRANLPGKSFASVIQHGETDWELLTRLLEKHGHVLYERDGIIVVEQGIDSSVIAADLVYGQNVVRYQFDVDDKTPQNTPNVFTLSSEQVGQSDEDDASARAVHHERIGLAVTNEDFPSFTDQAIERAAQAQLKAKKRWFASLTASQTLTQVRARSQVTVRNLGARYSGVWNVEQVVLDMVRPVTELRLYNGGKTT